MNSRASKIFCATEHASRNLLFKADQS
jgi:hypothetical protein